jgi:hypothetical protein
MSQESKKPGDLVWSEFSRLYEMMTFSGPTRSRKINGQTTGIVVATEFQHYDDDVPWIYVLTPGNIGWAHHCLWKTII